MSLPGTVPSLYGELHHIHIMPQMYHFVTSHHVRVASALTLLQQRERNIQTASPPLKAWSLLHCEWRLTGLLFRRLVNQDFGIY